MKKIYDIKYIMDFLRLRDFVSQFAIPDTKKEKICNFRQIYFLK